jgi:hypothetical protein
MPLLAVLRRPVLRLVPWQATAQAARSHGFAITAWRLPKAVASLKCCKMKRFAITKFKRAQACKAKHLPAFQGQVLAPHICHGSLA